jgi:hypothetical protein
VSPSFSVYSFSIPLYGRSIPDVMPPSTDDEPESSEEEEEE